MKLFQLLFIVSGLLAIAGLSSCSSDEQEDSCIIHFLTEFDMKPYEGEDLDCKTHIRLYKYGNVQFALKLNHCLDFAPFTIYDCNGDEFCYTSIGPCYIQESEDLGIIGIEKE